MKVHCRVPDVDALIFGGAPIGCLYRDVSEEEAKKTIDAAVEIGIKYFDTAPLYGAGLSEERFGKYCPPDVKISTKCGRIVKKEKALTDEDRGKLGDAELYAKLFRTEKYHENLPLQDYTGDGTLESIRQSKERLRRDVIQNMRLHDAEDDERFQTVTSPGSAVDTMIELKKRGEILELSLGCNKPDYLLRYVEKYPEGVFTNVMVAGCWNLLDQSAYDLLVACEKKNIKIHNVAVFASGCLFGGAYYRYEPITPEIREKVEKWQSLCSKYSLDIRVVALSFGLLPDVVERVAIGMANEQEVRSNAELLGIPVPVELWHEAKTQGLIRQEIRFD